MKDKKFILFLVLGCASIGMGYQYGKWMMTQPIDVVVVSLITFTIIFGSIGYWIWTKKEAEKDDLLKMPEKI